MSAKPKTRVPWAEMDAMAYEFAQRMPQDVMFEFGGSYRRRASTCGDLDVIVVTPDLRTVPIPQPVRLLRSGPSILSGLYDLGGSAYAHVDVWSVAPHQLGAFLWFVTGPKSLNVAMRRDAQRAGLSLSQYGVFDSVKNQLDDGTELGVARSLPAAERWESMLDPESRESWNPKLPEGTLIEVMGSRGDIYRVSVTASGPTCTCKGFAYRSRCVHVEELV